MDLEPLFNPRSIAVVGVSRQKTGWGMNTVRRLLDYGFPGAVTVVGSQAADLPVPNVPSLTDLPEPVDLLVIAVPAAAAVGVVREARAKGAARSSIVYSSGFAELDESGTRLQGQLEDAAGDLPLLGPNCLGLVNRTDNVYVSMSQYLARDRTVRSGRVGIVTQSGALGFVLASQLERYGVSFSHYVSVGNEARLDAGAVGLHLVERDDVAVVGLYLEAVRDAESLRRLAVRAHALGKRVVALKTGATTASRRATLSHTAAVAGDPMMFDAFCRKWGIVQADSDESFADLLMALQRHVRLPENPRFAVLTMSGGAGALTADRLATVGATVPEFAEETLRALSAMEIPGIAGHGNPVDLGGNFRSSINSLPSLLERLEDSDEVDAVVGYFTFGDELLDGYVDIARRLSELAKPAWMIWAAPPTGLGDQSLPPGVVVHTIEQFARVIRWVSVPTAAAPAEPPLSGLAPTGSAMRGTVTEAVAHEVLRSAGVPYVPTAVYDNPEQLSRAKGLPEAARYVVKVDSPQELHRARVGLLRLNVPHSQLHGAAQDLWTAAARLDSPRLVIQPQLDHVGEISVGVYRDPVFGLALLIGPGGAGVEDAEAYREVILLPSAPDALSAAATRAAQHLTRAPVDMAAFTDVLASVQQVALAEAGLSSMDINPLLITESGQLVAVDSLLICDRFEGAAAVA